MWKQWVIALFGLGVIVVPYLGLTALAMTWTLVIMGLVIAALSIWTGSEVSSEEYGRMVHSHA